MRFGVRLAVDVGSVRIGVAASDPSGLLASPVETVRRGRGDLARLVELVIERDAVEVLVGLPRSLSGQDGAAAALAREFAGALAAVLADVLADVRAEAPGEISVRLVDERMSTVSATRDLRAAGVAGRKQRSVVDQAAAVVFLQAALDSERATGDAPGEPVQGPGLR